MKMRILISLVAIVFVLPSIAITTMPCLLGEVNGNDKKICGLVLRSMQEEMGEKIFWDLLIECMKFNLTHNKSIRLLVSTEIWNDSISCNKILANIPETSATDTLNPLIYNFISDTILLQKISTRINLLNDTIYATIWNEEAIKISLRNKPLIYTIPIVPRFYQSQDSLYILNDTSIMYPAIRNTLKWLLDFPIKISPSYYKRLNGECAKAPLTDDCYD